MHQVTTKQHIDIKGFFINSLMCLVVLFCLFCVHSAQAQTFNDAQKIADLVKNGDIGDINDAARLIQDKTGLSIGDAKDFAESLTGRKIDIDSATELANSVLKDTKIVSTIKEYTNLAETIQNARLPIGEQDVYNLINSVNGGDISPELASHLAKFEGGLSDLTQTATAFADMKGLPLGEAKEFLTTLTEGGFDISTIADVTGSVGKFIGAENLDQLNDVAKNLVSNFENIPELEDAQKFLSETAPDIFNSITSGDIPVEVAEIFTAGKAVAADFKDGAAALLESTGLPLEKGEELLKALGGSPAGIMDNVNLVSSMAKGKNLTIENAEHIIGMAENLGDAVGVSAETISGLFEGVGDFKIPPAVGEALAGIEDLGKQGLDQIGAILENPEIAAALNDITALTGDPQAFVDMLGTIGGIALNPELISADPAAAAQATLAALEKVSPEALAPLLEHFGGAEALTEALGLSLTGGCKGCKCKECIETITQNHNVIRVHNTSSLEQYRSFFVSDLFESTILGGLQQMTAQFTTNMMLQVQTIGGFFDAKHQLETQRIFQTMAAKAHKDYHPSEGMCTIGTNVRSLAASERKSNLVHETLANRMMKRQLSSGDGLSTEGKESDRYSRLDLFIKKFCKKTDGVEDGLGASTLCKDGGNFPDQVNKDVNYTSAVENQLTLDIDFLDEERLNLKPDEENIFALGANLFAHDLFGVIPNGLIVNLNNKANLITNLYLDLRSVAAKRSVAQNSFAAITAMRAEGDSQAAPFLKAILAESGIDPESIHERLGDNPSYFAQMEVLTKDLYQNPNFYANLYDKPVNVERKGAALQALELMQDRDLYQSLIRSEAVLATLVESLTRKEHARITRRLDNIGSGENLSPPPLTDAEGPQ